MGLDIVAVRQARFLHPRPKEWDDACDDHLHIYTMPAFVDRLDGKPQGCYETDDNGLHFAAGSYSSYNAWRAWLSQTQLGVEPEAVWSDYVNFAGRPFVELINFADNEGAIGPVTSAKLAEDFRSHTPADDGLYEHWLYAFERAADDGFVIFR